MYDFLFAHFPKKCYLFVKVIFQNGFLPKAVQPEAPGFGKIREAN